MVARRPAQAQDPERHARVHEHLDFVTAQLEWSEGASRIAVDREVEVKVGLYAGQHPAYLLIAAPQFSE